MAPEVACVGCRWSALETLVLSTPGGGVVQFAAHGRRVRVVAVTHPQKTKTCTSRIQPRAFVTAVLSALVLGVVQFAAHGHRALLQCAIHQQEPALQEFNHSLFSNFNHSPVIFHQRCCLAQLGHWKGN